MPKPESPQSLLVAVQKRPKNAGGGKKILSGAWSPPPSTIVSVKRTGSKPDTQSMCEAKASRMMSWSTRQWVSGRGGQDGRDHPVKHSWRPKKLKMAGWVTVAAAGDRNQACKTSCRPAMAFIVVSIQCWKSANSCRETKPTEGSPSGSALGERRRFETARSRWRYGGARDGPGVAKSRTG